MRSKTKPVYMLRLVGLYFILLVSLIDSSALAGANCSKISKVHTKPHLIEVKESIPHEKSPKITSPAQQPRVFFKTQFETLNKKQKEAIYGRVRREINLFNRSQLLSLLKELYSEHATNREHAYKLSATYIGIGSALYFHESNKFLTQALNSLSSPVFDEDADALELKGDAYTLIAFLEARQGSRHSYFYLQQALEHYEHAAEYEKPTAMRKNARLQIIVPPERSENYEARINTEVLAEALQEFCVSNLGAALY